MGYTMDRKKDLVKNTAVLTIGRYLPKLFTMITLPIITGALTKAEYEICEFLARNRGQVFSKEQILEQVFGFDSESNDSTITTHIKNIRTKLSDFHCMPIKTVWGIGYKWEA